MAPRLEAGCESSGGEEPGAPELMLQRELHRLRIGRPGEQIGIGSSADRGASRGRESGIGGRPPSLEPELLIILQQLVGLEPAGDGNQEESREGEEDQRSPAR